MLDLPAAPRRVARPALPAGGGLAPLPEPRSAADAQPSDWRWAGDYQDR
jgi:hypothetical protein